MLTSHSCDNIFAVTGANDVFIDHQTLCSNLHLNNGTETSRERPLCRSLSLPRAPGSYFHHFLVIWSWLFKTSSFLLSFGHGG